MIEDPIHALHIQPDERSVKALAALREAFRQCSIDVARLCPPGRERSLVMTNLEQGLMWATKGVMVKQLETDLAAGKDPRSKPGE
jgi:non-homologous end joining protein Ku